MLLNGDIINGDIIHVPNTNRSAKTEIQNIGQGWLRFLSVDTGSVSTKRGQTFCVVKQFDAKSNTALFNLVSHYIDNSNASAWPYGILESPLDGQGFIRSFVGTNPAVATEITETVPTGARWRLKSIVTNLLTGAAFGGRTTTLIINDGTNDILTFLGENANAILSNIFSRFQERGQTNNIAIGGDVENLGHEVIVFAGWIIKTSTSGLQGDDDYAAPILYIEEWLEP